MTKLLLIVSTTTLCVAFLLVIQVVSALLIQPAAGQGTYQKTVQGTDFQPGLATPLQNARGALIQ